MLTWFDYFKIAWLSTHIFYSFFHWKPSTLVSSSADCFRLTQGTNIFKNWHICPWLFYFVWIFSWLFTSQESIHQRTIISFISHFNLLFDVCLLFFYCKKRLEYFVFCILYFVKFSIEKPSTLVANSADCLLQTQRLCARLITHCFSVLLRFFPYCFFVSSIFFYSSLFLFFLIVCCRYSVSAKDWSPIGFFLLLRVLRFKCILIVNTHSKYSIMLQSILLFPDKSTL